MRGRSGGAALPIGAILGPILLLLGTWLHPMEANPNAPLAAFAEYAADRHWMFSHLIQLLGVVLIVAALVLLSARMKDGPAAAWAVLGRTGATASLAIAAALQAVDGVALKVMVDAWAAAPDAAKPASFQAALAVRQVEVGLASMTSLLFGLTAVAYGVALLLDRRFPRWMGVLGIAGGAAAALAGLVTGYTGFSAQAMTIGMPANALLMLWMIALGVEAWRRRAEAPGRPLDRS